LLTTAQCSQGSPQAPLNFGAPVWDEKNPGPFGKKIFLFPERAVVLQAGRIAWREVGHCPSELRPPGRR
jgi:hypothetical protein